MIEEADGGTRIEQRQFGGFKRDGRELADWVGGFDAVRRRVVMESTGIYWKSPYAALEAVGIRAKVKAMIAGQPPHEVLKLASARIKASRAEIFDALQGDLTASHYFVLDELMRHIEEIEARFDARLLAELDSERNALALLQTIPGVDLIGAAMLLIEIGTDMDAFGSADRLAS